MKYDPQQLVELVKANPAGRGRIRQEETIELVEAGQWAEAAERYAEAAEYLGADGELWPIWRELKRAEGKGVEQAAADLTASQLVWFATCAFRSGDRRDGCIAFEQLRQKPDDEGPHTEINLECLDYLLDERRYDAVVQTVNELVEQYGPLPQEQARAAAARCLSGDHDAITDLEPLCKQHNDDGELLADIALLYLRIGEREAAATTRDEALRAGVYFERRIEKLKAAFGLNDLTGTTSIDNAERTNLDDWIVRRFADPGFSIKPSRTRSPHWFGGNMFATPPCKGCDHPIRQWFGLDVREIEGLRDRLPSWSLLPLLGCVDCMVWMGRHDYEVDGDKLQVRLLDVHLPAIKKFSKPHNTFSAIKKRYARLEPIPPREAQGNRDALLDEYGQSGPLVAGAPPWIDNPIAMSCTRCNNEMIYVAALSNVESFKPRVPINNESGYQYHFACDDCRTLSVVAQWS